MSMGEGRRRVRQPVAAPVRGRTVGPRVTLATVPLQGAEPIGVALMQSLGIAYPTNSPMSRGGGGGGQVTHATGAGIVGRDGRRTGALQDWRGLHGPVARPAKYVLNAQGGPSSQPAYPSTGSNTAPGIYNALAGMGLPQVLSSPGI